MKTASNHIIRVIYLYFFIRLELSVSHGLKKKHGSVFSKIISVLQLLYNHYHRSPKAIRDLQRLAEAMKVKMMKPSKMNGTRWMPHLSRALTILLKDDTHSLYVHHFQDIIKNGYGGPICQGRAKKILAHLANQKTMHFMHFLLDVLEILSELSLEYQRDTCSLPDTLNALDQALMKLYALKIRPGKHLERFMKNTNDKLIFNGVQLVKSTLAKEKLVVKQNALVMSVIDHISGNTLCFII